MPIYPVLLTLFAFAAPALAVPVPRIFGVSFLVITVLATLDYIRVHRALPSPGRLYAGVAAAIVAFTGFSLLWSDVFAASLEQWIKLIGLFGGGTLFFGLCRALDPREARILGLTLGAGVTLGAAVLLGELLMDHPLHRLARGLGTQADVPVAEVNRGAVALSLLLLPLGAFVLTTRRGRAKLAGLALLLFSGIVLSPSNTALLAFIAGGGVLGLARLWPRAVKALMIAGLVTGLLGAPWIAKTLYQSAPEILINLESANAAERMEIWDFIARRALEQPVTGWGLAATPELPPYDSAQVYRAGRTVLHPHNAALQIWLEHGAIGAMFWSLLLGGALWMISPAPFALALAAASVSVFIVGYGMWQSWLLGLMFTALGLSAALDRSRFPRPDQESPHPASGRSPDSG